MMGARAVQEATINRLIIGVATLAAFAVIIFMGWTLGAPEPEAGAVMAVDNSGPKTLTLSTSRYGRHHVIRAAMIGPNGRTQLMSFVVDTGATDIVLPASMIKKLGFRESELTWVGVQTANGAAEAQRGFLRSLELGGPDNSDVIQRVPVMFMSDSATGGVALMGMSVLGRYKMTIEDAEDRIVLVKTR
jgi:clan AA aspartic protease (TIGR02281 family)